MMKIKLVFLVFSIFVSSHVRPAEETSTAYNQEPITEIVVIGQRRLSTLRVEISIAENKVYSLFNELNDDDEYDIECRMVAPPNSRLKTKQCKPIFFHEATRRSARDYYAKFISTYSRASNSVFSELHYKNPILREKILTMARENPELGEALIEHSELKVEYIEARDAYFAKDND